jgi:hypothetical protein
MLCEGIIPGAGFWALFARILASFLLWLWVRLDHSGIRFVALFPDAELGMTDSIYRAMWCLIVDVVVMVGETATAPCRDAAARTR